MTFLIIEDDRDRLKVERLYIEYGRLMYIVAHNILRDSFLAEDALQQSFIKIIEYLHKIDEKNSRKTKNFLVIICRNVSINIYNKRNKMNTIELDEKICDDGNSISDIIINQESLNQLLDSIYQLKPIYQEVVLLRYSQDFSIAEIAKLLDVETKTVQKRIERAKVKLSQLMKV